MILVHRDGLYSRITIAFCASLISTKRVYSRAHVDLQVQHTKLQKASNDSYYAECRIKVALIDTIYSPRLPCFQGLLNRVYIVCGEPHFLNYSKDQMRVGEKLLNLPVN